MESISVCCFRLRLQFRVESCLVLARNETLLGKCNRCCRWRNRLLTYKGNHLESFEITDSITKLLHRWSWLIASSLLGAGAAFAFSLLTPPRYETEAAIAINLDYGTLEPLKLVVEDRILDRVWQLMVADETLLETQNRVESELQPAEKWDSLQSFRVHTRLDARLSRWELIGIHNRPEIAQEIANAWMFVTLQRLDEAYEHAWNASQIEGITFDLQCISTLSGQTEAMLANCILLEDDLSENDILQFRAEIEGSHGILPILTYEAVHEATLPERPVLWGRGLSVFFGGTAGFVIGVMIVLALPLRGRERKSNEEIGPL